ncbi:hypothetical protein [Natrinema saccharevitans]|nr:hypothetical protein [Natrinema saccharevitans]
MELSADALEWLAVDGLLIVAGGLIKFRGWTGLIAGYDETSTVPDDVVQDAVGNTVLRVGIAALVFGILVSVMPLPSYLGILAGAVIVLDVLRMVCRVNVWSPQAT